ncbi:MAG: glycosyltransferase family 4 protein, partial [Bacteroidota bacterium]
MRVGFDISQTGSRKAGCGFFADGLIKALAQLGGQNEYILYPTFGDFYFDPRVIGSRPIEQENIHYGLCHSSAEKAREFWCNPPDHYEMKLGSPDIIHANN